VQLRISKAGDLQKGKQEDLNAGYDKILRIVFVFSSNNLAIFFISN